MIEKLEIFVNEKDVTRLQMQYVCRVHLLGSRLNFEATILTFEHELSVSLP